MTPLPDSAASSLGQYLQQIRKSKNLEIEQISAETRISKSTLAAIEADDFSHLPADAFARGCMHCTQKPWESIPRKLLPGSIKSGGKIPFAAGEYHNMHVLTAGKIGKHHLDFLQHLRRQRIAFVRPVDGNSSHIFFNRK